MDCAVAAQLSVGGGRRDGAQAGALAAARRAHLYMYILSIRFL